MNETVRHLIKSNPKVNIGTDDKPNIKTGKEIAKLLTRTVCKRPCMTYYYGADARGFTGQIREQLADEHFLVRQKTAEFIFNAIEHVCPGAAAVRNWIQNIAKDCAKAGKSMTWTTPDGLPVEHLAFKTVSERHNYFLTGSDGKQKRRSGSFLVPTPEISVIKMKNGSSPNLVHSLDGTHLRMVALAAYNAGLPIGLIHDSFGTNAESAGKLYNLIRKQMVSLYEQPVLENLMKDFGVTEADTPSTGKLDIAAIKFTEFSFA